jgi:hypothetical protein
VKCLTGAFCAAAGVFLRGGIWNYVSLSAKAERLCLNKFPLSSHNQGFFSNIYSRKGFVVAIRSATGLLFEKIFMLTLSKVLCSFYFHLF